MLSATQENGQASRGQDCQQHPHMERIVHKETAPNDGKGDEEEGHHQAVYPAHSGK